MNWQTNKKITAQDEDIQFPQINANVMCKNVLNFTNDSWQHRQAWCERHHEQEHDRWASVVLDQEPSREDDVGKESKNRVEEKHTNGVQHWTRWKFVGVWWIISTHYTLYSLLFTSYCVPLTTLYYVPELSLLLMFEFYLSWRKNYLIFYSWYWLLVKKKVFITAG